MRASWWALVGLALLTGLGAGLTGCSRTKEQIAASQTAGSPAPTVSVSYPVKREVADYEEFPGRTAAVDSVQVLARVTGYLDKIHFQDGAEVQQGQVLYQIDPRPYQAQYQGAVAQLAQNEANLRLTKATNARYRRLVRQEPGAVTAEELDQYQAQQDQAAAAVELAKANLETARLNLDWTKVTSPINGRLSRTLITRGNLIIANQTVLTNIVSQDPIYAYWDVDEQTVLRIQGLIREGRFKSAREGNKVPVGIGLANEQGYPHEGQVDFINNQVHSTTATLQVRALVPNPKPSLGDRVLSPGLFVRVRVPIGAPYEALLVVDRAVGTDQNVNYVEVVDKDDRVVRHNVTLGTVHGGLRVIQEGIREHDRVIVDGMQRAQPGATVQVRLVPMPRPGTPSPGAAPSGMVQRTQR